MVVQAGVGHPGDHGMVLQELGERHGVGAVPLHAQRQRLQAEDEVERPEGALAHAHVAQTLHAAAHDERDVHAEHALGAEGIPEPQAVVPRRGLREDGVLPVVPVHRAAVHDDAADARAVPPDPLRRGLHDDVRAPLQGLAHKTARAEGVVADERDAVLVRDGFQRAEVGHGETRVADRFHVDGFGVSVDESFEGLRFVVLGELHVDPQTRQRHFELVIRPAVQRRRRHDVVPHLADGRDREELRGHTRGDRDRADATLQRGDALLEHVVRGVHDARVDVPERAQAEQIGSMLRVVEAVGGGLVNRKRARVGGGIGHLARVHLQGLELELVAGHDGNGGDVERRENSRKGVGAEVRCAL
mmetsp:Transcript_7671/g.32595  ORF Transcript_7671/g.32595 Transcript_7671/m.32595 type:complete len:359 (+) Transcript_7671:455-1531(+)